MAAKKITLQCDVPVRDIVCSAIRDYARAAYPEGGSECAQVARYTLLELATNFKDDADKFKYIDRINRMIRDGKRSINIDYKI